MSILFINACIRENSRTLVLAKNVMKDMSGEIAEINLNLENIEPLDRELLEKREKLIGEGRLDDPMLRYAKQFAEADEIVIAAPFWDLSFPAKLKIYLEQIAVSGITFQYKNGVPMKQIQEWLGHSDFSTTANIYAHLDYNSKLNSAEAMVTGMKSALNSVS